MSHDLASIVRPARQESLTTNFLKSFLHAQWDQKSSFVALQGARGCSTWRYGEFCGMMHVRRICSKDSMAWCGFDKKQLKHTEAAPSHMHHQLACIVCPAPLSSVHVRGHSHSGFSTPSKSIVQKLQNLTKDDQQDSAVLAMADQTCGFAPLCNCMFACQPTSFSLKHEVSYPLMTNELTAMSEIAGQLCRVCP